jgi:Skp family chaperone for outer membrane proteins
MRERIIWRWAALGLAAAALILGSIYLSTPAEARRAMQSATTANVAVIDIARVLDALDEKTSRERELQTIIQERENKLEEIRTQLEQVTADLDILPRDSDRYQTTLEEAIRLQTNLEFEGRLAETLVARRRTQLQLELFNKIRDAACAYASTEGWDIVLTSDAGTEIPDGLQPNELRNAILSRRVLCTDERYDISSEVAQKMNNEFRRNAGG